MTPKQIIQAGRDIANKTQPESISQTDVGTPIEQIGIYLQNIDRLDVRKADKSEIDKMFRNFSLGIVYKGELASEAVIKALSNPTKGDTYKAADTGHYWCYDGKSWNDVGIIIPSDTAVKEDVDQLTALTLSTYPQANSYIGETGATQGGFEWKILTFDKIQPGDTYKIKVKLVGTGSYKKRAYAFYSSSTISAESFISGGDATTAAIDLYTEITVPDNAVMLCLSKDAIADNYSEAYKTNTSLLQLLYDQQKQAKITDAVTNSRIVPAIYGNGTAYNQAGAQLIYPCIQYNDQSTTSQASSPYSQLNARLMCEYTGEIVNTEVNGQQALQFLIPYNSNPKGSTNTIRINSKEELFYIVCVKYDVVIEDKLYFVPMNGSGGATAYSFKDTSITGNDFNDRKATLIYKDNGIIMWAHSKSGTADQRIGFGNTSGADVNLSIFNIIVSSKQINPNNVYNTIPEINNSYLIGKNTMIFGDSNLLGAVGMALMEQLGCSVYRNASGGRAMKYRSNQTTQPDLSWLYHWNRRKFIQDCKTAYLDLSAFIFFASYNDASGGGELTDAAIKAVMDNYPVIGDDDATVTAKLALFNAMTEAQRLSTFTYMACFAAYLKQIIALYPSASIYLTTMLITPASNTENDPDVQRQNDKARGDAINSQIRQIASWFRIPVIDTESAATYYYGNIRQQGTLDQVHFSDSVAYRVGYFTAKEICRHTLNINIPSVVDKFIQEAYKVDSSINASAVKMVYRDMNRFIKSSAKTILIPSAIEMGKVYAMDNTTGALVPFTFSRASQATMFDRNINMLLKDADMPRIDYANYDRNVKLLIEKSATNLITDSTLQAYTMPENSEYTELNWFNFLSKGARFRNPSASTGDSYIRERLTGLTVGSSYTFSTFVKNETYSDVKVGGITNLYDLVTVGFTTNLNIKGITSDIYKISSLLEATGNVSYVGSRKSANNRNSSILLTGYQFEIGLDSTSYIPTTNTADTRLADMLNYVLPADGSVYLKTTKQNVVLNKAAGIWNIDQDLNNEGILYLAIFDKILTDTEKATLTA